MRVVLVGAGHAHLYSLKRAAEFTRRGHELVVVAPDVFWYSGLATGVLGGRYPPALDRIDVGALAAQGGGRFICDEVVGIDAAARRLRLAGGAPLSYDVLSLTVGSTPPSIFGTEGHPRCYAVKPVRRLWELRCDLEARFRTAGPVTAVVAGGGATGCEIAANIAALAVRCSGEAKVSVLAGGPVLRQLPPRAAGRVTAALTRRGVTFRTGARVRAVEGDRALLAGGGEVRFDVFVNATGLLPSPLIARAGLPTAPCGGLKVDGFLRSVADPAVHGGGDCIALDGHALPRIGVYAVRQAPVLFHNLLAAAGEGRPRRFVPQRRFLWIMNLGDETGLAARGRWWWHGRAAFWLKDWIDRRFLASYQP